MKSSNDHRLDYRRFKRNPTRRNFGLGKTIGFAAHIALLWLYGYGQHQTRHAHHVRFRQFAMYLRTEFRILDVRRIHQSHLDAYAQALDALVSAGQMKVSYAQNLLSSVNTVMYAFRRDRDNWIAPAGSVGRRSQVRTAVPGGDWAQVENVVAQLQSAGNQRAAAIVLLARAFGMRYREAVLGDLNRLKREAQLTGYITVLEGTKGGRRCLSRRVEVGDRQKYALQFALSARPKGSANLLASGETFKSFLGSSAKAARPKLKRREFAAFMI